MISDSKNFESVRSKLPQVNFGKDRVVVLHMAISWANRTWPRPYWLEVSRNLSSRGYKVITVGKGADYRSDLYQNVINMVDRFTISETRELIKNASVFCGMDSGLLHVAQTTGVPIVGIFTVANPKYRIYPRKERTVAVVPKSDCRFCLHEQKAPVTFVGCKFNTNACLQDITPAIVIDAIKEVTL
jgi:ADP-heptose:LPS heptosyltransferase